MILFKIWAKHKVKSYIYCVNQFLREKHHKKWNRECKQKHSLLFSFCNIFYLSTCRTQNIAWWHPVFEPDFYIIYYGCLCSLTLGPRPSAPRPLAPISSALGPKNIARTNSWIKHITYSRLYLFKIQTLYLFKNSKRPSYIVQNKWKGFSSQ